MMVRLEVLVEVSMDTDELNDLMVYDSVVEAVRNALCQVEGMGFTHRLMDAVSIHVEDVRLVRDRE